MKNITLLLSLFFSISLTGQNTTAEAYILETETLFLKEKFPEGLMVLNEGINAMPDSIKLYDYRGNMLILFKLFEPAIEDFSTALELADIQESGDTLISTLYMNRGAAKSHLRDFEGAYEDYLLSLKFDSTNISTLNNIAAICSEIYKQEEALVYLHKVIEVDSNFTPAYVNIGYQYQEQEEYKKSLIYFDKAVSIDPEEPLAYSNRSFSKLKLKDYKGAMKDINYSLKLYPTNSYALKIRALIHIAENNFKKACEDLQMASELKYTERYGKEVDELMEKYCK